MTLTEKVAYIKGLVEALGTAKDDKVLAAVIDLLTDLAQTVSDLDDKSEYLEKYIEEIDEDLGVLEDEVYGDGCDCCDDDCDCCDDDDCDCCDDGCIEVECPACGETVSLDDTVDFDNVKCPACGETFSCVCDDDDCDCGKDEGCDCCHSK